jgi:hypothetical protein
MSDAFNSVKAAIKAAVAEYNKQIKTLTSQRDKLLAAVAAPETNTAATLVKSGAKSAAKSTGKGASKGPGMLNVLLPFMEGKPSMKAAEMLKFLHTHGYPNAKANSVYATLANELKKPNSRLEKIADGDYRVSAAYFSRPVSTPASAPAEAPAAVETPEVVTQ